MAEIAARQHGVVVLWQLAAAGLERGAVAHRVAQGRLIPIHRGVYLLGPLKAQFTDAMAAVLACGDGAVLSHHAAAALYGLRPAQATPGDIDVTVPARNARTRPGIHVHRVRWLAPTEVTRHEGIPVTTPHRTLLDLATMLAPSELTRALEQAQVHGLMDPSLNEQFERHLGARALKAASQPEPALTRSEAETRVLQLIRAARLPHPSVNARVSGYEVDFLWAPPPGRRGRRLRLPLHPSRVRTRPPPRRGPPVTWLPRAARDLASSD